MWGANSVLWAIRQYRIKISKGNLKGSMLVNDSDSDVVIKIAFPFLQFLTFIVTRSVIRLVKEINTPRSVV